MLFSWHAGRSNVVSAPKIHSDFSITGKSSANNFQSSSDLKRGERRAIKSVIRKKALDDSFQLNLTPNMVLTPKFVYFIKEGYGAYNIFLVNAHPSIYNLRGPPSII